MLDTIKSKSMHHHSFIFVVVITLLLVASAPTTNASLLRGNNKIDRGDDSREIQNADKETRRKLGSDKKSKKAKQSKKGDDRPQHDVTLGSKLFDAYEKSVKLGIIDPLASSNPTSQKKETTGSEMDPIAKLITETITAAMSKMGEGKDGGHHMKIRIENEITGNTFTNTDISGLNFSPVITVTNDMHDSLHDNNKAHSDSGHVFRQNGVADFTGALHDNNNAYSEHGNVLRQNGVISGGTGGDNTSSDTAATSAGNIDGGAALVAGDDTTFTSTVAATDNEDDEDSIIIINKIINNIFTTNKQNGLIVTPIITVENNMSNALYNNNGATSNSGDVKRQNGVADFTNALKGNNNAYSEKGDVIRQNGIITAGDFTSEDAQVILDSLVGFLEELGSFLFPIKKLIKELFGGVTNVLETLIEKAGSNILPSELVLKINPTEFSSEMKFKDAIQIQDSLLNFLSEIKADNKVMVLFEPIMNFLESIPQILEEEEEGKEQQVQEDASLFPSGFEELPKEVEEGKEQQVQEEESPFPSGFEELPEEEEERKEQQVQQVQQEESPFPSGFDELPEENEKGKEEQVQEEESPFPSGFDELPEENEKGKEGQVQEEESQFPSGFDEVGPKNNNKDRNVPLQNNINNNNNRRRRHLRRRNNGSPRSNNNNNNNERRKLGKGDDVASNNDSSTNTNNNKCSESNSIGNILEGSFGGDNAFTGLASDMVTSNLELQKKINDSVGEFVSATLGNFF